GKWHLTGRLGEPNLPRNQGFDVSLACGAPGSPGTYFYPYRKIKLGPLSGKDALGLNKKIIPDLDQGGRKGEYLTDRITDETIRFLKRHVQQHPQQPFFAYVSHYAVHTPLEAKPELVAKYREKLKHMHYERPAYVKERWGGTWKQRQDHPVYAAMIESVDESLKRIVDTLESLGVRKNTLIVFTADNGGLSNHGAGNNRELATTNYPLRNGKGWCYEGGIREPWIMSWPGHTPAGKVVDTPVVGTDLYPTFLDVAGLPLRPRDHVDGVSFRPLLEGRDFQRGKPIFWHSPCARPTSTGDYNATAVRSGNYKLIEWYDKDLVELFDIAADPGETHNLVQEKPEVAKRLLAMVHRWRSEIDALVKKGNV
ncbi:MAG: DUF4976 domain-containing protein, partial [Lentisphaerae bacterium]